jgi:hypothetical protein
MPPQGALLGPIIVIDGSLIRSRGSVRAIHAQALPIVELNVML